MKYHIGKHPSDTEPLLDEPADPEVVAHLRAVVPTVPFHTVDWDSLRASIVGDAAALIGRRVRKSWTTYVTRWAGTMLPAGVAASVLAGLFVVYTSNVATQSTSNTDVAVTSSVTPAVVLSAVTGGAAGNTLAATVTQSLRAHEDILLDEYVP
jgi:hypothetical protein